MSEGIHVQAIIDQLEGMGEEVHDADDQYVGLSYSHLIRLLQELQMRRTSDERLRTWLQANTRMTLTRDAVGDTIGLLNAVKHAVGSLVPVVTHMWQEVVRRYEALGIKLTG